MALVDNTRDNKIIKILPEGKRKTDRLHPKHVSKFKSRLLGDVMSIENVMYYLNKRKAGISILDKVLTDKDRERLDGYKTHHVPNYWYAIELVVLDKILSDKELLNEILKMKNLKEKRIEIYSKIKRGAIEINEVDSKYIKYAKGLKAILNIIADVRDELGITEINNDDDYKIFKKRVTEEVVKDIEKRLKTEFLDIISTEDMKKAMLGE